MRCLVIFITSFTLPAKLCFVVLSVALHLCKNNSLVKLPLSRSGLLFHQLGNFKKPPPKSCCKHCCCCCCCTFSSLFGSRIGIVLTAKRSSDVNIFSYAEELFPFKHENRLEVKTSSRFCRLAFYFILLLNCC